MPRVLIMNASTLQTLILNALPGAQVSVEDVRGDGAHYTATVAATAFAGKTRVQQHRMVHAALKGHVNNNVAVAIQTVVAEK
ncbi:MAG: BolA/IbaG family iron-sulfur metabolism protein [Micavibrio sp.]|nr:BolA/IbaG family iron-sulfur metabolism protein [Micavibrio sp.]MBK9561760.1 BolA/IbaG family iron-sulfur metabolism protein [Micavibrio sp.]